MFICIKYFCILVSKALYTLIVMDMNNRSNSHKTYLLLRFCAKQIVPETLWRGKKLFFKTGWIRLNKVNIKIFINSYIFKLICREFELVALLSIECRKFLIIQPKGEILEYTKCKYCNMHLVNVNCMPFSLTTSISKLCLI